MSKSVLDPGPGDISTLKYLVTHVFCPLQLPDGDDHSIPNDCSLTTAIVTASRLYSDYASQAGALQWPSISRMLGNLQMIMQSRSLDRSQITSLLGSMKVGDMVSFLIRAQNAAVVFRKQGDVTIFESFEASPKAQDVMTTQGKLICSYPGPAIEIPNSVFDDGGFLSELANFLVHMNHDILDATATTRKARSTVLETRDTTHPRYITELLTGILRSVGRPAEIVRIRKRVGDEVTWKNSKLPWRRSPLWLLIRVAIQTSLDRSSLGYNTYKAFVLFFMCGLAKEQMCARLPNDLIQFISSKISRRLRKLGSSAPDWLSDIVLQTCTSLRSILNERWELVQAAQRVSPSWIPSQLNLTRDIQLSLLSSGNYIQNALDSTSVKSAGIPFRPNHRRRGTLDDFLSSSGDFFEAAYSCEPYVTLYDVEWAVEQGIDCWVDLVTDNNAACVKLEILANKYSSSAVKTYAKNPELLSVMLLTTVELWVALDKLAIREIPMLADYSPEVPTRLLEDLLLLKAANLDRLRKLYQYLSGRHSQSRGWTVFSPPTKNVFSVRFYRQSPCLQRLKIRIEEAARKEVHERVAELERLNARYANLQHQAAKLDHEFYVDQYGNDCHSGCCEKCHLEEQEMDIAVHEWPLPAERIQAEAVVFELDCPVTFNMWRSATFHLLVDLCSPSAVPKKPYIQLFDYSGLRSYVVQHPRSRISLVSDTKPFIVTHYKTRRIPTTPDEICVNNGLTYYGFDRNAGIPVSDALSRVDVAKYCTYELHSDPYRNLQKYVNTTCHASNEVVANQADCPIDISIHEFLAFGHLRSGGILQWLSILRELRGRSLSFRRHEVHLLLAQAISQVGPLENTGWIWHQALQDPSFCNALLAELDNLVRDVEANWLEAVTMDTVSLLLRRLLASNPDEILSVKALRLLRAVRTGVFVWVEELSDKLTGTPGNEELRGYLRDAAAICRSTFDVDPGLIRHVLCSSEDIDMLLFSVVLIHDHTPNKADCLSTHSKLLLDRDQRLSLAIEDTLGSLIQGNPNNEGIDRAIKRIWYDYRPGSKWSSLQSPNSRWLSCATATTTTQSSQMVLFNLLDGSLLVDGKPVGRLPSEILQHSLYNQLLGEQVLDIIPADVPGMDYSTRGMISGHQVYFSLRGNGSNLVIQAKRMQKSPNQSEIMQLIPQEKLRGDLPDVLIEGHAHWLSLSSSIVEICPLSSLWETSPENWKIDCTSGKYRVYRGDKCLIDIRSRSWDMVSNILKPLDTPRNLLVSVSSAGTTSVSMRLSVALPRYSLSFYVDGGGDLQCHSIRGMVYDANQSVGTMFGLANQLVLRPKPKKSQAVDVTSRCILIPEGTISFHKLDHHVRVEVDTGGSALQPVTYQMYTVDTDLGCLTGNGSLTDRLYCAYLHALTSGCGTDPLTGRSGTEEALSLLRSAGCWSIMKFSSRDEELLGLIASVCPSRNWYPKHLTCMQRVEWLNLPTNSQHHELFTMAKEIKEHYERLQLFQESQSSCLFHNFPSQEHHLLRRSARRAAHLYPFEFVGRSSDPDFDVKYTARDQMVGDSELGEFRAYTAARTVYSRTASGTNINILKMAESWKKKKLSGDTAMASFSLRYDESWLSPDLRLVWIKAYNLLRRDEEAKWWRIFFSLPAMAYSSPERSGLVSVLVTFASLPQFRFESPPHYDSYNLSDGYHLSRDSIRNYVTHCANRFEHSPESSESAGGDGDLSRAELRKRQRRAYDTRLDSDATEIVDLLLRAWPCETPPQYSLKPNLYDEAGLLSKVKAHFSTCYRNLKLKEHFNLVQQIINSVQSQTVPTTTHYSFEPAQSVAPFVPWILTIDQLFFRDAPRLRGRVKLSPCVAEADNTSHSGSASLAQLITTAEASAENPFQRRYVSALRNSATCFGSDTMLIARGSTQLPDGEMLEAHYVQCRKNCSKALRHLTQILDPKSDSEQALERAGQWPRITTHSLLRLLASNSPIRLPDDWKECLIQLTLLILELQRAQRLLRLYVDDLREDLRIELQTEGCDGWDAEAHPDWLLIQLQGNFFVRRVQAEVANEMISPSSHENTAMQLNMGEGKSSVIVPIVVVDLADGDQLVRVIVPKALTAQMFQILVDRLGGLTNRRIYYLPFSRSLQVDHQKVAALRGLMSECMEERGILVVQPEHVLSLKLVSVEKQLLQEKDRLLALPLLELQKWLHSRSRDILDESDEILHVRYQLVYTIGLQEHMEGFPERWTTTQQVLGLVNKHASLLKRDFPHGVEYECGPPGSFPHLRVLQRNAGEELVSLTVQDIMDGRLPNFSFGRFRSEMRRAIRSFISCRDVPPNAVQLIMSYFRQSRLWNGLLLLRGVFATGILIFAFKERRWRVDYGLAPTRTMLAVPYRAKDVPAQRAEFGHPDIAIILTCLSYYYGGLTEDQLRLSFEILLKQDDPSLDYNLWVKNCAVSESFRTLSGVNLKSSEQWGTDVFPLFKRNRATIDFYLSNVVFPKEAKEFPSKLSCSGWDLAEKKGRLLTGFSGTNDGQYLLPLHITQRDPVHQRGTNAKVLSYLLQPENNHYLCMTPESGERRTTREFLEILDKQKPEIRVLLDVGAQMLELENPELARTWLDVSTRVSAAIYFNEDDELTVLTRDGRTQSFLSSPFAQQLDQCVIYLDDAHTRGTNIKFPTGFRAAVTLGPKVTKDRLAQGCMRMRKLGHGHSIKFFAPLEVDWCIRSVAEKDARDAINTMDILLWAISETCNDIQQRVPCWAQQGTDHTSRYAVWTRFCRNELTSKELSEKWLQPEAKKLEELYGPKGSNPTWFSDLAIRERCRELGVITLRDVSMEEEQEREVTHEAERERQIERPPKVPPAAHSLHPDVVAFVKTGIVPSRSQTFRPAFKILAATSAATDEAYIWSANVLVTADFEKTINPLRDASGSKKKKIIQLIEKLDEFLRPVQWIVSGENVNRDALVILSPFEVERLMPEIRSSNNVRLHAYTPRTIKAMKPCDDLALYSVPPVPTGFTPPAHLMDQLNVFSGQLYLKDYEAYVRLCRFLCVYARDLKDEENIDVESDGFIAPNNRPEHLRSVYTFQRTPLNAVRSLIALRRKGMRFAPTHMGRLLDGWLLSERDFESDDGDSEKH